MLGASDGGLLRLKMRDFESAYSRERARQLAESLAASPWTPACWRGGRQWQRRCQYLWLWLKQRTLSVTSLADAEMGRILLDLQAAGRLAKLPRALEPSRAVEIEMSHLGVCGEAAASSISTESATAAASTPPSPSLASFEQLIDEVAVAVPSAVAAAALAAPSPPDPPPSGSAR